MLRSRKPTSAGRRFQTVSAFTEITTDRPERSLTVPKPSTGGRNAYGRITARHRGRGPQAAVPPRGLQTSQGRRPCHGGHDRVRPQSQRPHRPAALPRWREALHPGPARVAVGDVLRSGQGAEIRAGNALPMRYIPVGSVVAQRRAAARAAAASWPAAPGPASSWWPRRATFATLRLPSTEMRRVPIDCRATIGEVGNAEAELIKIGKAGRNRWKGVRPQTRGVAMNPVDHPLGGGEGKSSGGRHPVSPWGSPEGRTRHAHRPSDRLIIRRRRGRGARR